LQTKPEGRKVDREAHQSDEKQKKFVRSINVQGKDAKSEGKDSTKKKRMKK